MKIKNRTGQMFLAEETLKMLIAVLSIIFLVSFLVAFILSATVSEKTKQAEGILNGDEGIIASIKTGKDIPDFSIPSPTGRYLFGFTESKPDSCIGESCLCICEKSNDFVKFFDKNIQLKDCNKKGICSVLSNLAESFEIKIEKGEITSISITQVNGMVEIKKN